MWFLTSEEDTRILYIVPRNEIVTIGRSVDVNTCDFPITEDASISRKHATVSLSEDSLTISDLGSKYGTFVNNLDEGIPKQTKVALKNGDIVRFGALHSVWKVNKKDLITCTSTVKGENMQVLKSVLAQIGGKLKNDWDDSCLYLTMPAITLTIKVVLALVQGSHIVKLDFWNKCSQAVSNNTNLPDPKDYLPQVIESTLNQEVVSFYPDSRRKNLFVGKTFIFFSGRQMDMYKNVLTKSSATPLLMSKANLSKTALLAENIVVINCTVNNTSQEAEAHQNQINNIVSYLKSKGKRVVADAEIGLAILFCSTEKYCNPGFSFSSEVMKQATPASQVKKTTNVLAPETQESTNNHQPSNNVVIDDSMNNSNLDEIESITAKIESIRSKRKLSEESDELASDTFKRVATEENVHSDDFFNFIQEPQTDIPEQTEKKLNFSKASKRKQDVDENDDNLFNFVSGNDNEATEVKKSIFSEFEPQLKKPKTEPLDSSEISPVNYNFSLKELLEESSSGWKTKNDITVVKKEDISDELEDQMNNLDIGTVIVTVKKELIIEKTEPVHVELPDSHVKNFKKFKKVWPLKMKVVMLPKSSLVLQRPCANSMDVNLTNGRHGDVRMEQEA